MYRLNWVVDNSQVISSSRQIEKSAAAVIELIEKWKVVGKMDLHLYIVHEGGRFVFQFFVCRYSKRIWTITITGTI